ncbi:ABC transporter substrate-binding protein [Saccharopolyspora griseoalba]|uniref:ABC transporter substrate-binding protein n=1 Tax=Saccharopolyspora griseoalba TaxID=1431848 RepID=A0ABW2LQ94_9PSEU
MVGLSRRQVLGAGLGLAGLTACGDISAREPQRFIPPARPGQKVHLTYWSWLKDLQKVCDIWNERHPDVEVEAVWIPVGNAGGYQRLFSSLAAGGGPDLAQVELRQIPAFLLVDGMVDLSRYGARQHAREYDEAVWNQVVFDRGIYGLPQDSGPCGFFYRADVMREVGGAPPATWAEWAELARRYREADKYLEVFSLGDTSLFASLAAQAGARWFRVEDDGWVVDMTDEATTRVAEFFDAAIDDDLVDVSVDALSTGWVAAAASGRIGAVTNGSWADALLAEVGGTEGLWRVAPMPTWGPAGFGSAQNGGSSVSVLRNCEHPKEAVDFALWMTTTREGIDAMIEHCGIGWSPAAGYIGQSRREPSEFFGGQRYNQEVFAPAAQQQNERWIWSPTTQQTFNVLGDGFREKITGESSIVEACRVAQDETVAMLRNEGLKVRAA